MDQILSRVFSGRRREEKARISCGDVHTMFLTKEGHVYACGYGEDGQLGTEKEDDELLPTMLNFRFTL